MPGIESRASCLQGKCSSAKPYPCQDLNSDLSNMKEFEMVQLINFSVPHFSELNELVLNMFLMHIEISRTIKICIQVNTLKLCIVCECKILLL